MTAPAPIDPRAAVTLRPRATRPPPDLGVASRAALPVGTLLWGAWALASLASQRFDHFTVYARAFRVMAWVMPEPAWGALALVLGGVDLALVVRRRTPRWRYPLVFAIALFWTLVFLGILSSDAAALGVPIYATYAYAAAVRAVDLGATPRGARVSGLVTEVLTSAGGLVGLAAGIKWFVEHVTKARGDAAKRARETAATPLSERELAQAPEVERLRRALDEEREEDRKRLRALEDLYSKTSAEITRLNVEQARAQIASQGWERQAREAVAVIAARDNRITVLEREAAERDARIATLERQVDDLTARVSSSDGASEAMRVESIRLASAATARADAADERRAAAEKERDEMRARMVDALADAEQAKERNSAVGRADRTGANPRAKDGEK